MRESYRQQFLAAVYVHVRAGPACDELAALHDQVLVGERPGEVVILFYEQDSHLAGPGERAYHALDVLDDGGLDALGGLVEYQQRRPHCERAPDRQLLLLPAPKTSAAPVQPPTAPAQQLDDSGRH